MENKTEYIHTSLDFDYIRKAYADGESLEDITRAIELELEAIAVAVTKGMAKEFKFDDSYK